MTTSSIHLQAECPSLPTAAPKRRRRLAATGAAEDCHTCRKTQTPCDRRRPYCSQCLSIGKKCSGYRTILTWGVGVASRGKLRGLSLPVAGASGRKSLKTNNTMAKEPVNVSGGISKHRKTEKDTFYQHQNFKRSSLTLDYIPTLPTEQPGSQLLHPQVDQKDRFIVRDDCHTSHQTLPSYESSTKNISQSSLENPGLFSLPNISSCDGSTFYECNASISPDKGPLWPPSTELDSPAADPLPFNTPFKGRQTLLEDTLRHYDSPGPRAQSISLKDCAGNPPHTRLKESVDTMAVRRTRAEVTANLNDGSQVEQSITGTSINILRGSFNIKTEPLLWTTTPSRALEFSNAPLRVRSLLDFYDKAICPVLVAFDGASNPYRTYIMPLALQDRGLQSALAALATNNLRMRRLKEVPCLKGAPTSMSMHMANIIGKPSAEEQTFKSKSIEYLNNALARPGAAEEDSVLATLLILCLFHVCDSGFSRFKTQLIGVQKLLRMRGVHRHSEFVGWVEMFFAWFDVMTSAINDRETQIHNDSLAPANASHNLGSVEQFSGCEGRLFKLLARLGRLNLLSQGREVRTISSACDTDNAEKVSCTFAKLSWTIPDERQEFWHEWYDVRERLFTWALDESISTQPCYLDSSRLHHDTLHISESFRFSALLYTERLAYPSLPSSSSNLQDLVSASIYHIGQIGMKSCVLKFLLWPLFITGTECVLEEHRNLIRLLCGEIQKESGFYNNVSSLEVLERFWTGGHGANKTQQAFRWRDAMPRVDGEYIVI